MSNPGKILKTSSAGADPRGIKATIGEIPLRLYLSRVRTTGIISYDHDNCYPQRMKILSDSSVMAKSCKDLYGKYINGMGFEDATFSGTLLNSKDTANQVLKKVTNDVKNYWGMAFYIGYDGMLDISTIKHLPFDYVRLTDDEGKKAGKYAIHPDWAGLLSRKFDEKKIDYLDKFDPSKSEIKAQIERAGGFDKWSGQVLWVPMTGEQDYPETIYDSAYHSIHTDMEIDIFKNRNVSTSFLAYYMMYYYGDFDSNKDRIDLINDLMNFQGGRNAAKIMLLEGFNKDNRPDLEKIDINNNDKLFAYHEESSVKKIRMAFRAPAELVGEDYSSGFDTERIDQARSFYNSITQDDRDFIKGVFEMVLKHASPAIMGGGNYAIKPLYSNEEQRVSGKKKKK